MCPGMGRFFRKGQQAVALRAALEAERQEQARQEQGKDWGEWVPRERILAMFLNRGQLKGGYTTITRALQKIRGSQGGKVSQATGRGHRWTREEAQQARQKGLNRSLGRFVARIGVRVGQKLHRRPQVKYRDVRARYADKPDALGIWWDEHRGHWWRCVEMGSETVQVKIGERAALRKLGYLPNPSSLIPVELRKLKRPSGRKKRTAQEVHVVWKRRLDGTGEGT